LFPDKGAIHAENIDRAPQGDKRYIRRSKSGQFTAKQLRMGRSLAADSPWQQHLHHHLKGQRRLNEFSTRDLSHFNAAFVSTDLEPTSAFDVVMFSNTPWTGQVSVQ
jgi:hypothetical protein